MRKPTSGWAARLHEVTFGRGQPGARGSSKKVTPAHILLGIVREGRAVGARVIVDLGADGDAVGRGLGDGG